MAQAKQLKPEKTRKSDFKFTRDLIDGHCKRACNNRRNDFQKRRCNCARLCDNIVPYDRYLFVCSEKDSLHAQSNYICAGRLGLLCPDGTSSGTDLSSYR